MTCTCATCPEHGATPLHADLTEKQRDILAWMRGYARDHGMPPTLREVGVAFAIGMNAARDHLRALKRKGAVLHAPGKSRGWRAA